NRIIALPLIVLPRNRGSPPGSRRRGRSRGTGSARGVRGGGGARATTVGARRPGGLGPGRRGLPPGDTRGRGATGPAVRALLDADRSARRPHAARPRLPDVRVV